MDRSDPTLHRDNPDSEPLIGNIKVTRDDWLNIAMAALIRDGVEGVKIQAMGAALGVSRSSFYWYFKSRQDLLDALLEHWRHTNTAALVRMAERPADTITEAVGNVFRCVINPALFDTRLDFAVRDWARRSQEVRAVLDASETQRLSALQAMFERFDYPPLEATARARILYYMQIGYDDAKLNEPMETRNRLMPAYLVGFTGKTPSAREVAELRAYANALDPVKGANDGSA
ncbi:TetR/AcrR family transcriptional regulator [Roseobacter denitrificans]|uniref:Transcriptional regulator, TetR family, putative n=1 Tax=Roseobacter denitrificans (strain ATCC 33942 / OCh 114) TaxID=375451 RepID=Q16AK8_ROSDO|nr:TetR/AcrR family transcriptional regulator [Roseobacter denitrificans]ABG30985.1 transcriptional regulator, TetR family, putative [Roseobacter denitrificans OCh 114]AVL54066.1 TetR/AcrR family transcriptional regulator [Roseobacter denitrificans]SFG13031.1 transcriptional regulator, TetR family [Roseobacter denitrificans OCh 114]